jgi:DNA mismatch repair protein MutL
MVKRVLQHPAGRPEKGKPITVPIRLLPPEVSSKIAAGEVTERPASVVKELVENSLDAQASEISIEVRTGGIEYIRVVDNGVGIAGDEVELAFERFATSKLTVTPDLEAISTLGFRGEALPSIAAVSHVTLVTRTVAEGSGTRVEVADGRVVSKRPEGAAPGTAIVVRHLFKSIPARRKFLRSAATEASRIQAMTTRLLLAYPGVKFQLSIEGALALSSSGSGDLRETISEVYDSQVAHAMLELGQEQTPDEASAPVPSGMIGPPSLSRANRSHISIFVNSRWVQNRMLAYALQEAYQGFLKERRFPLAVVNIAVPHDEVDVNVHPSKTEVRFRQEGSVFSALQHAVRRTLTTHSPVPEVGPSSGSMSVRAGWPHAPSHYWPSRPTGQPLHPTRAAPADASASHGPAEAPDQAEPLVPRNALPALRVLGQSQSMYIAAEGPDGIYLIDQHAAHERVLFERVRAETLSQGPQVQGLMEPATVELDPRQSELVESQAELIARLGFQVEGFGGRTYILRGVPALLPNGDPGQSFEEVLDLMADGGGFESWEERAAYSIACHGAIRAGKKLNHEEMTELTRLLEQCQQPHTCPHGRPTMIHLSSARLEREFGRT